MSSLFSAAISSILGVPPPSASAAATISSSSEMMKTTIINEIEESLLGNKNNTVLRQTKLNQTEFARGNEYYERDFAIGNHAIQKAIEVGIDPRYYVEPQVIGALKEFDRPNDDTVMEEQLEFFFTKMDSEHNISLIPDDERDSDASWKEKTLSIKFPESPIDSFFIYLKEHKPALFKALQHHSLFTGKYKSKKKPTRKTSRKEKKDKERKKDMPIIEEEGSLEESSELRRNCLLGCLLTKSLIDGTLQSQLIALAMLLHASLHLKDTSHLEHHQSIPVGNILGALFHNEAHNDAEPSDFKKLNPFQSCMRSLLDDEPDKRLETRTRGDAGSQSTLDDRHSEIGSLYAPSNVESIQAEHGTETASIVDMAEQDHNNDDDNDEDEEDLLAQALALSLGNENSVSSENPKTNMPSLSESALSKIPSQTNSFGNRNLSPTSQSISDTDKFSRLAIPTSFPAVHPLSTFGPFCELDFWKALGVHDESLSRNSLVWVTMESAIVSLLVNIACGVDYAENPQSLPNSRKQEPETQRKSRLSTISPGSPSRSFVAALAAAAASKVSPSIEAFANNTPLSTIPLSSIPAVSPHPVTFLLIDLLFEMIIPNLLSAQEESKSSYFLTWYAMSLLKLLRTNFTVINSTSISPSSVGLGKAILDNHQKPVLSLPERLLKHIFLFIGTDVFHSSSFDQMISFNPNMKYRDSLRILGIDTLVAGLFIFYPTPLERNILLSALLERTPFSTQVLSRSTSYSNQPNQYSIYASVETSDDKVLDLEYYRSLLLQRICHRLSSSDISIPKDVNSRKSESNDKGELMAHLRTLLPKEASGLVLERMYEAVFDAQHPVDSQSIFQSMLTSASSSNDSEQIEKDIDVSDVADLAIPLSFETILISRLRSPHIMNDALITQNLPSNTLFWGEFCLLLKIQQKYIYDFVNNHPDEDSIDFKFDEVNCSEHLILTNGGRTVRQTVSRTWSTVLATSKFEPNTGEHTWAVKLQRCEKGHVFIGIATSSVSVDTYIGGDENGWGLIGTKTLWHQRKKIKTGFGEGFSSRSVMYVRYNSDSGQLWYSNKPNGNWNLAFENIPKESIYPAVSLYQKDDSVCLFPIATNQTGEEFQSIDEIPRIFSSMIPFLSYAFLLFDEVELILDFIDTTQDSRLKLAALNHPFLTCLLPSISAGILLSKPSSYQSIYASLHLLPHLTMFAKKIALLYESVLGLEGHKFDAFNGRSFVGDISGNWKIKSGSAGTTIPAQEYFVQFVCSSLEDEIFSSLIDLGDKTPNLLVTPIKVVGEGQGGSSSFDAEGIVVGTRIKFQETWNLGGTCIVEGRLSLDGCSFVGTFRDVKTGSVGQLQGSKQMKGFNTDWNQNYLYKIAIVLGLTVSKLASILVLGFETLPSLDIFDTAGLQSPNWAGNDDMDSILTVAEDTKDDFDLPDVDAKSDPSEEVTSKTVDETINKWMSSALLSGGLRYDLNLHDSFAFQLISYFNLVSVDLQFPSLSSRCLELKKWWIETVFPNIEKYCKSSNGLLFEHVPFALAKDELANRFDDPLFSQLQGNSGIGKRIDEHLVRYSGFSALSKIGGEPMQAARRRVLTALLYQSGCVNLCYEEDKLLNLPDRDVLDKPPQILLDIWRAAQRVIEYVIRLKQSTGISYSILSQDICRKAELLLLLNPCGVGQNIFLSMSEGSDERTASCEELQSLISKILSDTIEFFQISMIELTHLRGALFRSSLRAYSRAAGFRSLMLLLSKLPILDNGISGRMPSQSSLLIQPAVIEFLLPALFGKVPLTVDLDIVETSDKPEVSSFSPGLMNDTQGYPCGHFNYSLLSVSNNLMEELRQAFESVYELIAQLIQRSTWTGNRDTQCIALSSWNIPIIPEDHSFLNRIGIFRILQTVLDDTRASNQRVHQYSSKPKKTAIEMLLLDVVNNSNRRLTQLALRVIHSLASQVAFCKTSDTSKLPSLNLQRYPSGPETLSQSLFDMLYAELYNCMKNIILELHGDSKQPLLNDGFDDLEGEKYAYRILRLLYSVSESSVCQRYLATPKWLSLLVASIGYGDLAVQRRLLRLLRRLLISLSPENVRLFIHETGLFSRCEEIVLSEKALDEDDIDSLITGNQSTCPSVHNLLILILRATAIIYPGSDESEDYINVLRHLYNIPGGPISLIAESVALFRLLEDIPIWKSAVVMALRSPLQKLLESNRVSWDNSNDLRLVVAVMSVLGGHIDRLRVGGTVTLKPFSLVSSTETFALRLASVSHSSGMLVAKNSSTVEVVLMERSRKVVKGTPGSRHSFNTQYALSLSGPLPIRTVKMNLEDVVAAPDIPPPPDFFDPDLFTDCLKILDQFSLPFLQNSNFLHKECTPIDSGAFSALDDGEDDEDTDDILDGDRQIPPSMGEKEFFLSELDAIKYYVSTSTFRAVAECLQFNSFEVTDKYDATNLFSELLSFAIQPVSVGGLSEIEVVAERYASLWNAYVMSKQSLTSPETVLGDHEEEPNESGRSLKTKIRVARSQNEDSNSSSRGISANLLAAMMSGPSAAEANHAREQMMEMGFPREWCEFALRKCRYNVELAINLCFEHGSEMNQLIAEDSALASAANSARSGSGNLSRFPRQMGMESVAGRLAGTRRGDSTSARQQLMSMGFPPNWCAQALEANHNDVDAALSWILSHGEELITSDESKDTLETKDDSPTPVDIDYGPNPLSCISGAASISPDLYCSAGTSSGFPSVGCRGYHVTSGKWYYEVVLTTSGCMQFGWVDLGYEGGAEQGQGVGDDVHSWAYDGWRKLKWHDLSTCWGAKWSPGDVIGISLDMDNFSMSFTLNGYAEEIGMGLAFSKFSFQGGMYPCASFNRNEKFQFNFGFTKFKYLPEGYRGYMEHIQQCLAANTLRLQAMLLFKPSAEKHMLERTAEPIYFEDCVEEHRGESDFLAHRRYFLPDDSLRVKQLDRNTQQSISKLSIPAEPSQILKEFSQLAGELCILYSRLIILRLFTSSSRVNIPDLHLQTYELLMPPSSLQQNIRNLFYIFRESSLTSLRTRTYLQTMSILPSSSLPPSNLGSVLMAGGTAMLFSIQTGVSELMSLLRRSSPSIYDYLLDLVNTEIILSTKREYSADWRVEGGTVPVLYIDALPSDLKDKYVPSLPFAWWLSILLVEKLLPEAATLKSSNGSDCSGLIRWIKKLICAWTQALSSPVIAVKLCGVRILCNLIQELYFGDSSSATLCSELDKLIPEILPLVRIEKLVLHRMEQEKAVQPICSEYLQNLIDFAITIRSVVNYSNESRLFPDQSLSNYPPSSSEENSSVEEFNWDSVYGSLMSDDGWEIWSGTVQQLECDFVKTSHSYRPSKPDQIPPPLLPGSHVIRHRGSKEGNSGSESARASLLNLLNDRNSSTTTEQSESFEEIGTVLEIIDFDDYGVGSGRVVRWNDNSTERIRWGAYGEYDVIHVTLDSNGKIQSKFPPPLSEDKRIAKLGFGADVSFGIILRLRSLPLHENDDGNDITGRFDGLMEWPDFNAVVYVTGAMFSDGHWTLTEQKLIAGADHSDWTVRFGQPHWQAGTTYDLSLPRYSESEETVNGMGRYLLGQFQYQVNCIPHRNISVIGDIKIQQSKLFTFDPIHHASSIAISQDRLAAACTGGEGKCCAFASVGFSTGVHYWEFKIEQCELGNIFIGVAEKPSRDQGQPNYKKWQGYGFVNLRLSFRNTGSNLSGERVYGDLFQTGDTVGVLLDMNRGRLSFFLDAMKYGEHSLIDLGEAFDGLTNGSYHKLQPKVFYPVVGFKRAGDRVTISPRWISSTGHYNMYQEFKNISRAWNLLSSWSEERPTTTPQGKDLWIYREAWRDWLRWKSNRYMKVRTRCRALNLLVGLDISPRACVDASIRLGLPTAFYHGDRIVFVKSCGRNLETKEEAVILGSFRGQLWYRHDSQNNTSVLVEGSNLAWCLAPHDIEDLQLVRRGNITNLLPSELIDIPLCRLPAFRGGLLRVIYESGAVMREGLEIDSSDHTCTVEHDAIVYALERRVNSSNIARYRVYYNGSFGWISERIRGGNEEYMVRRVTGENQLLEDSLNVVRVAISNSDIPYRLEWKDVSTPLEALREWETTVIQKGFKHFLESGEILAEQYHKGSEESFHHYLDISTTYDGRTNWPVEYDMMLTEFLSRVSSKLGQSPFNVSTNQIIDSRKLLDEKSPLLQISSERLIARASIIRMANVVLGYALPYIELSLPEERWHADIFGVCSSNIETLHNMSLKRKDHLLAQIDNDVNWLGDNYNQLMSESRPMWQPPSVSRRFRTKRRVLFTQTKRQMWENILDATTTPTPLHQDEYEDPREIKQIRINRIKATKTKLTSIASVSERLTQSVFGQLHKEMRNWPSSSFRRAYIGKGHGGQKRAFKVKFLGEGVNDYGGPYRAVFEQIVDEVQCDSAVGQKRSDRCLLPLLVPCPNRASGVGSNQDKFLLNSSPTSPLNQELMQFFGKLTGTAMRHNMNMGLDFSCLFWRPLVRLPISRLHLETVDYLTVSSLAAMEKLGQELENSSDAGYDRSYVPKEWSDMTFSITTIDGTKANLVPGGEDIQVNLGNWREYVYLVERYRLRETAVMFRSYRDGLASVIPVELFPLFTPPEMEEMFSGSSTVDIKLLKQCTEYDGIDSNSQLVANFWSVLEEMTDDERTLFLRFVWARSRMPASTQDLIMNFKLQSVQGEAQTNPDKYLPHAQTCFFSLGLPPYTSKEVLREKLLYAIHNSPNMDADVRLHNAEGWTEA